MQINDKGMPVCHVCGKAFKDKRGLAGHLWSVHGIKATECEEYMNGPKEVLLLDDGLRTLFDLNEDLKEYDTRLKRAKASPTGSVFGLGFIPTYSDQDRELIELLEYMIKVKEDDGQALVKRLIKMKNASFDGKGNLVLNDEGDGEDTGRKMGFLEEIEHDAELNKKGMRLVKARRLQKVIDRDGSQDELREAIK